MIAAIGTHLQLHPSVNNCTCLHILTPEEPGQHVTMWVTTLAGESGHINVTNQLNQYLTGRISSEFIPTLDTHCECVDYWEMDSFTSAQDLATILKYIDSSNWTMMVKDLYDRVTVP